MTDTLDFEIDIGPAQSGRYPVRARSAGAGEAHGWLELPFPADKLEDTLRDLEVALLRSGQRRRKVVPVDLRKVQDFGGSLAASLFSGDVRTLFDVSRQTAASRSADLRVQLRVAPPELAVLPWEFLHDPREDEYLCLRRSTPVVRYLELPHPPGPLHIAPPLRVLGLVAAPSDQDFIDVPAERRRLEEALAPLTRTGTAELVWVEQSTWRCLQQVLRKVPWNVFHFVGHGMFDPDVDEGQLALCEEDGSTYLLSASALGRLLDDQPALRLVVLNSCEGARGSTTDVLSSTAATLMRKGLPAVLSMQYEISDRAAVEFAHSFYGALADGQPVERAVTEARIALSLATPGSLEWAVPVLHLRATDGRLFVVDGAATGTTTSTTTPGPTTPRSDGTDDGGTDRTSTGRTGTDRTGTAGGWRTRTRALRGRLTSRRGLRATALAVAVVTAATTLALVRPWAPEPPSPPSNAPELLWRFRAGGHVSGRPAVSDELVYTGSQDSRVYALEREDGDERWAFTTGKIVFSSPRLYEGGVYVGSRDANVYALNAATGEERWRFATTTAAQAGFEAASGVQSSPAVVDGTVYFGADDSRFYAVDAASGQQRWKVEVGGPVLSSPAVADGVVYFGSFDGSVYALDAESGTRVWQHRTGDQVWSSPTVADGSVFVGSNNRSLLALDAATGEVRWSFPTGHVVSSSPAYANGIVYVGSFDHHVYAVDAASGQQRWRFRTGDAVFSSPFVTGGVVYVGSHDGHVYALDAVDGQERWRYRTGALVGASPTVVDGVVYVGSDDGFVYAVKTPPGG